MVGGDSWMMARDGADLSAEAIRSMPARARVDVGITKDFEVIPDQPGTLVVDDEDVVHCFVARRWNGVV